MITVPTVTFIPSNELKKKKKGTLKLFIPFVTKRTLTGTYILPKGKKYFTCHNKSPQIYLIALNVDVPGA